MESGSKLDILVRHLLLDPTSSMRYSRLSLQTPRNRLSFTPIYSLALLASSHISRFRQGVYSSADHKPLRLRGAAVVQPETFWIL
jgi:hypothetical protein